MHHKHICLAMDRVRVAVRKRLLGTKPAACATVFLHPETIENPLMTGFSMRFSEEQTVEALTKSVFAFGVPREYRIAKRARLYLMDGDNPMVNASLQSGEEMIMGSLEPVESCAGLEDNEPDSAIHLLKWFATFQFMDVCNAELWRNHGTFLQLVCMLDANRFFVKDDLCQPFVYANNQALRYRLIQGSVFDDGMNGTMVDQIGLKQPEGGDSTCRKQLYSCTEGRMAWHGTTILIVNLLLSMRRIYRGTQGKDNICLVMLSKCFEGAFHYSPIMKVIEGAPELQMAVGVRYRKFFDHKHIGISIREHWGQMVEICIRSNKSASFVKTKIDKHGCTSNIGKG